MLNYIEIPPRRIPRGEMVLPTLMIGECVFAARGNVSMVRVNNQRAGEEISGILISQALTGNPATPESLSIRSEHLKNKKIIFLGTDPKKKDSTAVTSCTIHRAKLEEATTNLQTIHESGSGYGLHFQFLKELIKENPKVQLLIIAYGNDSESLPESTKMAADYLRMLNTLAKHKKISIVLVYDQWNGTGLLKNGPFKEIVERHFFSIAKLFYSAFPDRYVLECIRAPRRHDFFPITYTKDENGIVYHRGIDINRITK